MSTGDESNQGRDNILDLSTSIAETLKNTDQWLGNILDTLEWSEDELMKTGKVQCNVDPNHIVHETSVDSHAHVCKLKKLGYSKSDLEDEKSKSTKFFYEKSSAVISLDLDHDQIRSILSMGDGSRQNPAHMLPLTMSHINDLTREQRLVLHRYCVDTAVAAKKPTTIPLEDLQFPDEDKSSKQSKSMREMRAEERDMKRRRQSYRTKNVHTGKKSYLEVIRELIEKQTGMLGDKLTCESKEKRSRSVSPAESKEGEESERKRPRDKSTSDLKVKRSRSVSPAESKEGEESERKRPRDKSTSDLKVKRSRSVSPAESKQGDESEKKRHKHKHKSHKSHKKHKKHKSSKKESSE